MFSVIIPLYNKAPYIQKTVESVLKQTFTDFELIIINDGSTDNSFIKLQEICYNLQEEDPELFSKLKIINQKNQGVSATRNQGVEVAKHDYIAFLDADDWWNPHFLAEMKKLIELYPDGDAFGASYYQVKYSKNRKANIGLERTFTSGYINYFEVYVKTLCMPLWTCAVVLKRNVFQELKGFNPNLKLGEDFDLWIRIALKYKIVYINKALAFYNHDVDINNRAVVSNHLYKNGEHVLFNIGYLLDEEKKNESLKKLLDALRIYSLFPYYLDKNRINDAKMELRKVNWQKQRFTVRIKYLLPVILVKSYFSFMKFGSLIKQYIIRKKT